MLYLRNIKIYDRLIKRNNDNSIQYAGILVSIANDMNKLLEFITKSFPAFPDHGFQHSLRILNFISELLGEHLDKLTDTECFCLILTALFHDTAMAQYDCDNINVLRSEHHSLSYKVIDEYFDDRLQILGEMERVKAVVEFSCKSHGLELSEFQRDISFDNEDRINGDIVRYRLMGYLIRIGDLMDLEQSRVNSFVLSKFRGNYSDESFDHNKRHENVILYNYDSKQLHINVLAENLNQFKIWTTWFTYLKDDILNANTDLRKYEIFFPKPETLIETNGKQMDVEEIHFEIDDNGGIWNILSQSIYTDKFDFLREIIQNAIDASLICIYKNDDVELKYQSPRFWNSELYCSGISVLYSEKTQRLFVMDSGIGMNKEALHKFLFKVSGSGYKNYKKRGFEFPSIAKFGIGFVSCLINADEIEIYTKNREESILHQVNLSTDTNLAFLQDIDASDFYGTVISLRLKEKFTYNDVLNYISNTFVYSSVPISCINIDELMTLSERFNLKDDILNCIDTPYRFEKAFDKIELKRKGIFVPINDKCINLREVLNETKDIIEWLAYKKDVDDGLTDRQKTDYFKDKIKTLNALRVSNNIKNIPFPLKANAISESVLFVETEIYADALVSFEKVLREVYNENDNERSKFRAVSTDFMSKNVSYGFKWKYMAVILNDSLEISDIIFDADSEDMKNKNGIIFINDDCVLKELGLEFSYINGFFFSNGELVNSISKFVGLSQRPFNMEPETRNIVFGNADSWMADFDNLDDMILNNFESSETEIEYIRDLEGDLVPGMTIENHCDILTIYNNEFVKIRDVNPNELSDYKVLDGDLEALLQSGFYSVFNYDNYTNNMLDSDEFPDYKNEIDIISSVESNFYQDGIKIPFDIQKAFPCGFFKIICNCTAEARVKLNVTRHETSELKSDMEPWVKNVVSNMQRSILENITEQLNSLNIIADFKELICYDNDNMFLNCFKQNIIDY